MNPVSKQSTPLRPAQATRLVGAAAVPTPSVGHAPLRPATGVSLLIQQEVSTATGEVQFDAPVIATREAITRVLVRDGQTIVLGGLKDQQRQANQGGIPVLSSLPLVGGLFGSVERQSSGTELHLFLTPRIIRTDADADSVTAPKLPKGEQ